LGKTPKGEYLAKNSQGRTITLPPSLVTAEEVATYHQAHPPRNKVRKTFVRMPKGKTNIGDPMPHGHNPSADSFKSKKSR
jgi:hypothetical protein